MKSIKGILSKIGLIVLGSYVILFYLLVGIFIWDLFFDRRFSSTKPSNHAIIPPSIKANEPNQEWKGYPEISDFKLKIPVGHDLIGENKFPPIFNKKNNEILLRHLATSSRWLLSERPFYAARYASMTVEPKDDSFKNLYDQVRKTMIGWQEYHELDDFTRTRFIYVDIEMNAGIFGLPDTGSKQFDLGEAKLIITPIENLPNTKARDELCSAIAQRVYDELKAVTNSQIVQRDGFDLSLMPKSSVKYGAPELKIWENGLGIYDIAAYANPGEEGFVYLKVFDNNVPIFSTSRLTVADRLESGLKEIMGWSKNPRENFLYQHEYTIYCSDSSRKFPARFELWFKAKNGSSPERKLVDAVYMVDSWER